MKRLSWVVMTLLLVWTTQNTYAADMPEVRSSSKINAVMVYPSNAKINRTASLKLPKGESIIVLENLSNNIINNSVQLSFSNSRVALISVTPRINNLQLQKQSKRIQNLEDSLKIQQRLLRELDIEIKVTSDGRDIVLRNNPLGSAKEKGFTVAEIQQLLDFRKRQLNRLETELLKLEYTRKDYQENLNRLQRELNSLRGQRTRPTGEILLRVSTTAALSTSLEVSYAITQAGWTPLYDLKSEGIDKGINLYYKAEVYQNSGIDWENVKLSLSTSNPSRNNDRPILSPIYLNFMPQYQIQQARSKSLPVPGRATAGAPPLNMAMAESAPMEDAELDGFYDNNSSDVPEELMQFDIKTLQDIPSDHEKHIVAVNQHELAANYEYHSVPKLDEGAFLLAKLSDYGKYNLLAGKANIFFEGTYLGQTYINPNITSDTLLLSLGRDEQIVVERKKLEDLTSRRFIGANKKEEYTFEIVVRNNKRESIQLEILDQVPLVRNKQITVELEDKGKAEYLEEIGKLSWELELEPNETKKLRFSYSIKYPKNQSVRIEH